MAPGDPSTRDAILAAAEEVLSDHGYAGLSTRRVADAADVPLSQIHYHFGSKTNLLLALLSHQNERLLQRQTELYDSEMPLWKQWEQACDYLDEDLRSGYVRVLQEMIAAGWSEPDVGVAVRTQLSGWMNLLASVADRVERRFGGMAGLTSREVASLVGTAFLGSEAVILLGFSEEDIPVRSALRRIGQGLRAMEEGGS